MTTSIGGQARQAPCMSRLIAYGPEKTLVSGARQNQQRVSRFTMFW